MTEKKKLEEVFKTVGLPPIGPNGRTSRLRAIWLLETETSAPRLVTAYPE